MKDPSIANQSGSKELLPLIGNLSSGIIYCSGKLFFTRSSFKIIWFAGPFISVFTSRFPHSKKVLMWIGLVLCIASLLGASFASRVS